MKTRLTVGAVTFSCLLAAGHGHAAPPATGPGPALAREAKQLMAASKYAQACPKFAESQRLSPSTQTLIDLASCHDKLGKTATAYAELTTALDQARASGSKADEKRASALLNSVGQRVSRITISVPAGSEKNGLGVTIDGIAVPKSAWGAPYPIDPGTHEVAAMIPEDSPGRAASWWARKQK